jgi:hypothetical protein
VLQKEERKARVLESLVSSKVLAHDLTNSTSPHTHSSPAASQRIANAADPIRACTHRHLPLPHRAPTPGTTAGHTTQP